VKPRRRRTLTGDEMALWSHVTRHVTPMPGRRADPTPPDPAPPPPPTEVAAAPAAGAKPAPRAKKAGAPAPPAPKPAAPPSPPVPAPLERRLRQRLARGHHPIDAVIDLHGMRQDEAHAALRGFVRSSQAAHYSVVLVVTGKGGQGMSGPGQLFEERGVLRRVVPHWLRLPDIRGAIVGFEEAAAHHGGAGALYVRLRKPGRGGAP
jgi:DNA-nicking Smr family endonuclease